MPARPCPRALARAPSLSETAPEPPRTIAPALSPEFEAIILRVLANAATSCTTAARDTVVTLKARDRAALSPPVRGCAVVRYDVTPRDDRLAFTPLDGGPFIELRADSARALSLTTGRYEVRIQAPRCAMGTDTLQAARRA